MDQTLSDNDRPLNYRAWNWWITAMLAAGIVLYSGLRILSLWTPRLWGDELFTFSLSQGTWITLIKRAALDMIHPPLFYPLLKFWIYFAGSSMSTLRLLTVSFSIAAVIPLIVLGRKLEFRMPVIILALTLMAVNNYLIIYGYYLRSYSLLLLLSLSSQALFVRFLKSRTSDQRKSLVLLTLIDLLFVYTHYFGWLMVIAEYLWVAAMDRRLLRQLTFATAILVLCFLPWIGVIIYVSTKVSSTFLDHIVWYRPPGSRDLLLLLRCFNGGFASTGWTLLGTFIFLLILLAPFQNSFLQSDPANRKDDSSLNPYALLAWLSIFPIIVSFVVSKMFTWIWEPRYVIIGAGSYLLLISACAFRLRNFYARAVAVMFLLAWSSIAGFTGNLAEVVHGPNCPSYWLARDLSQRETRVVGPINVYGISPYAEQGLRLALNITGERRFKTVACSPNVAFSDDYFWIAITEHDPIAAARVKELLADPHYDHGEPLYRGEFPQRHILIPLRRK
ncbi:MAG: hypothetical protein ABR555_12800 [Pyrinomonadaceae bacterium]